MWRNLENTKKMSEICYNKFKIGDLVKSKDGNLCLILEELSSTFEKSYEKNLVEVSCITKKHNSVFLKIIPYSRRSKTKTIEGFIVRNDDRFEYRAGDKKIAKVIKQICNGTGILNKLDEECTEVVKREISENKYEILPKCYKVYIPSTRDNMVYWEFNFFEK